MRKYFLLSAVALMATTTANATTDYAEVTAKATIEVANTLNCAPNEFGWHIVVKQNNSDILITMNQSGIVSNSSDFISLSEIDGLNGATTTACFFVEGADINIPDTIALKNGTKEIVLTPVLLPMGNMLAIAGDISIPANITAGDYIGTFTISQTY